MNILLIDKRVSQYEDIVAAIDPVLAIGVVFDYYADTFETIKTRISEALGSRDGASGSSGAAGASVGLIQHNYNEPTFSMVAASTKHAVAQVETLDPALETWAQFKDFIVWCKNNCGAAHFDMMACALYSNPDWKYIVDTLAAPAPEQTGVDIRASTDNTGSAALGGDWFLESHAGVNLKTVYFTELIEAYRGVLVSSSNSLLITSSGAVYATGYNGNGQLGLGDTTDRNVPTLITTNIGSLNIVAVSCGNHSLFLTSTGAVYAAGNNYYGQLGLGDTGNGTDRNVPTLITTNIGSLNIVAISAGVNHSLFLTSAGAVYATGYNSNGDLGLGDLTNRNVPTLITTNIGGLNIVAISGGYYSLFLTSSGAVYATGDNSYSALGLGDNTNRNVPTLITTNIGSLNIVAISAGMFHALFLTSSGAVYATGRVSFNGLGELGVSASTDINVPTLITTNIGGLTISVISAHGYHSLFLTSSGAVYSTGFNYYGELGLGDTTARIVPTLITTNIGSLNIVAISGGFGHSFLLTNSGAVYTMGINNYGNLGLGDLTNRNVPTLMSGTYTRLMDSIVPPALPAKFVSVGSGTNTIAYSYDGVNWTGLDDEYLFGGISAKGKGVAYSPQLNLWVAVGEGTTNTITYSSNGITWTGIGTSIFSTSGLGISYSVAESLWVAVGHGTNIIAYSTNGIDWTGSGTSVFSSAGLGVAAANISIIHVLSIFSVTSSITITAGTAVITATPTSESDGAITYTSSNAAVATIHATTGVITRVAAGTVYFTATQAATSVYAGATRDSNTLTVSLETTAFSSATFTVTSSITMTEGTAEIITAPTSASDGAITYASSNTNYATIHSTTGVITRVAAGTVYFTATQAATSVYAGATRNSNNLVITLTTSAFASATFAVPSTKTVIEAPFAITTAPTSASDGAITYASSNAAVATIHATTGVITLVSTGGPMYFTATQAATSVYAGATRNSNTLTVSIATSAFASATFAVPSTKTNVDAPFAITTAPSSASDGAITYASSNTAVATIHSTTGEITLVSAGGPMYFTATQAATAVYAGATRNSNTLTVSIATSLAGQTLTGNLAGKDFTGTSFAGTTIQSGVSLAGATLSGANFTGATLSGVNFAGATVTGTNFANANIVGATNLPEFSIAQKLQLLRNANNSAIGAVQFSSQLTGADINAAITSPVPAIAGASFVIKAPSYNELDEKVVTVISTDVSGNASIYIPLNDNETVKINGVAYTFDGTNVLDANDRVIRFLTILDTPFRLYAGSIIGLNVVETLNSIKIAGAGLYEILFDLCVFKN